MFKKSLLTNVCNRLSPESEIVVRRGATTTKGRLHYFSSSDTYSVIGEHKRANFTTGQVVTIIKDITNNTVTIVLGEKGEL